MSIVAKIRHWWHGDPNVVPCSECGCPIQAIRVNGKVGTVADGMREHNRYVHPEVSA